MVNIQGSYFHIRPVQLGDEADILAVYCACNDFLSLGPALASLDMVRADLALSREECGVFCGIYHNEDGAMLGIVDFVCQGWQNNPETAYLSLLMIAAPHRGSGLGSEVVRLVESEIMRSGQVQIIQAGVQVNNPSAIRFWQRMGYQIVSGAEDMPDGTTVYHLEKVLVR